MNLARAHSRNIATGAGVAACALFFIAAPQAVLASCSLLDDAHCVSSFCSIESGDSCEPDVAFRPSDIDEITVHASAVAGAAVNEINSPLDAARYLRTCWKPPQGAAFEGLSMDVRFAFDRKGGMRKTPNIVFFSPDAPPSAQKHYGLSIREAIISCSPLPFSARFASTVEARLLAVRFIVDKKTR